MTVDGSARLTTAQQDEHYDVLATPAQRKRVWAGIASLLMHQGRFAWAAQALHYEQMDDPPREWPEDSEPARMLRGESIPPASLAARLIGWLLQQPARFADRTRSSGWLWLALGVAVGWILAEQLL